MKKVNKVAYGAVFSALGVLLLSAGALLESLEISLAVMAGLLVTVVLIEFKTALALCVWAVVSALSLVLFPLNSAAWMFALFLGWYPVFKQRIERIHYVFAWAVKVSAFNVCAVAYWFVFTKILMLPLKPGGALLALVWVGGNLGFVLFDLLFTRLITVYIFSWRNRLGFKG